MPYDMLDKVKVAVIGDFCLDVYWYADMTKSVLSRETPHFPLPVQREKMSPGGAGNVAANITALDVEKVYAIGVIGDDWRGECLRGTLAQSNVDTSALCVCKNRFTNTYIKPMKYGYSGECAEQARLDFEGEYAIDEQTEKQILAVLEEVALKVDVICVCDQMKFGCITEKVREKICTLGASGKTVFVDSRDRIALYKNVIIKPNDIEASRAVDGKVEDACTNAEKLSAITGRNTIVTCGENGCVVCENGKVSEIPAFIREGEIDFCGAGDTFLSALAAFTAGGFSLCDAARFANAASSVTVHKVGTTGTASRKEIFSVCGE